MNVIIRFIQVHAFYIVFALLQVLCLWQIVRFNSFQQTFYFNTSRGITANFLATRQAIFDYFNLRQANDQLVQENLLLRKKLSENYIASDSSLKTSTIDSFAKSRYTYVTAGVIQSSTNKLNNFITLDKGRRDGIAPGMAVISPNGITGVIHDVSDDFSLVLSVLNTKFRVSPMIPDIGFKEGFISWDGKDENYVQLSGVNKFEKLKKGFKVYTSNYSPHFPAGIQIGEIAGFEIPGNSSFYEIQVKLSTEFNKLHTAYIVKDIYRAQIDSLNRKVLIQ
jgi:rod shape-determining protein MreC